MPQSPPELSAKFPGGDAQALKILEKNFVVDRGGVIHPRTERYSPTVQEVHAIDYLFLEWDYGYTTEPLKP